jgi:hypothetical protein
MNPMTPLDWLKWQTGVLVGLVVIGAIMALIIAAAYWIASHISP